MAQSRSAQIISMIEWSRTSRLSIQNSLSAPAPSIWSILVYERASPFRQAHAKVGVGTRHTRRAPCQHHTLRHTLTSQHHPPSHPHLSAPPAREQSGRVGGDVLNSSTATYLSLSRTRAGPRVGTRRFRAEIISMKIISIATGQLVSSENHFDRTRAGPRDR